MSGLDTRNAANAVLGSRARRASGGVPYV